MSSFVLQTVRVVNPSAPDGFMIINESDLTKDHELWIDPPAGGDLRVGKGPRGKFYVWLGRERVEGPFDTEGEALTAMTGKNAT